MIDIILILLIVLIAFIGTKRGFVLTVFDLFSGIVSFIIAKITAPIISPVVYDTFAKKTVITFLTEKYNGVENTVTDAVDSVFGFLPDGVLTYCKKSGMFNASQVTHDVLSEITTVAEIEENIVAPVVTAVINIILFAIISFIAVIVLRIVGRLISKIISKIKIVDKLNSALGGVAGVLKGVVYVFIISAIFSILSFASETIASYAADSRICSLVAGIIGIK